MTQHYISRTLESSIKRATREFPAVVVTGPRQSGKTTMLRHLFGGERGYVSLELPDVREAALSDPRGFLKVYPPPVILDEVQCAPELLPYIKERIDDARDVTGQYILTGSQNLLLMERVTESLAGRAAMLKLLPLSHREISGEAQAPLAWESEAPRVPLRGLSHLDLWRSTLRGCYPELVTGAGRDQALWHASYMQTYLERDVRSLRQVGNLAQFQSFLRLLAARCGQLLNLTSFARDLGIAVNTAKAWLSVLEASFQIVVLRPYHANIGKRLVKTPKVYFTDTGTLCYLAGLREPSHAAQGPMGGAILEAVVLSEILKTFLHRGQEPRLHFWRTASGSEVDIIVEAGDKLIPIEVKLSATPRPAMAAGIKAFQRDLGEVVAPGYVVHPGDVRLPLTSNVTAIPFAKL